MVVIFFPVAGVVLSGGGHGHHTFVAGGSTPVTAAQFWEKALPGTPMPKSIVDLVNKGVHHSPLGEQYYAAAAAAWRPDACFGYSYRINCGGPGEVAASGFFFHEAAVRVGATMNVTLPPEPTASFLPRDVADKIPFFFPYLADALAMFKVAPGSAEAAEMSQTLRGCEAPPLADEQKACATSLEGVVEAAARMLGGGAMWAAASAYPAAGLARREYAVEAVAPFAGGCCNAACHGTRWPYAVYNCHASAGPSKAYVVTLRGGATVAMAALCHRDTSNWNPEHPALVALGTRPGGAPVCHFLPYGDLMFGKKATNA
uniref:BURP domain-containing protein n=1 Tax=Oryza meridionalis TaxID=40149 RepID=A0A0E0FDK2_9ORYZ